MEVMAWIRWKWWLGCHGSDLYHGSVDRCIMGVMDVDVIGDMSGSD